MGVVLKRLIFSFLRNAAGCESEQDRRGPPTIVHAVRVCSWVSDAEHGWPLEDGNKTKKKHAHTQRSQLSKKRCHYDRVRSLNRELRYGSSIPHLHKTASADVQVRLAACKVVPPELLLAPLFFFSPTISQNHLKPSSYKVGSFVLFRHLTKIHDFFPPVIIDTKPRMMKSMNLAGHESGEGCSCCCLCE